MIDLISTEGQRKGVCGPGINQRSPDIIRQTLEKSSLKEEAGIVTSREEGSIFNIRVEGSISPDRDRLEMASKPA